MKKVLDWLWKFVQSIVAIPLVMLGAICLVPFIVLYIIIGLPATVVNDIWNDNFYKYEEQESQE